MSLEKNIVLAMSYLSNKMPVPASIAKKLIAELCMHRAKSQWLQSVLSEMLTESYEASLKAEELMDSVQGTFAEEDSVFLQAYMACADKQLPTEKMDKGKMVLVKGDKE